MICTKFLGQITNLIPCNDYFVKVSAGDVQKLIRVVKQYKFNP
jgi:hypothetical protein